jgi:uncharacterized protein YPO0396
MDDIATGYIEHLKAQLQTTRKQRDALLAAVHELAQDHQENDPRRVRAVQKANALVEYMNSRL